MDEIKDLLQDINILRDQLHKLINDKDSNLKDTEVIAASQMLNAAVLKYTEILSKKINK